MSANDSGTTDVEQLTIVTQVGGVRAHRIRRDLGITTVVELSLLTADELQAVYSIGPVRSEQILTDAQRVADEWRDDGSASETRVAVVAGDGAFDDLNRHINEAEVVDNAIDSAGVDVDESLSVGYVAGGEMGGDEVQSWVDIKSYSDGVRQQPFETPWSKYARFLDPLRFVDDDFIARHDITDISEVPAGRMPETVPLKTGIPFDVDRASDVDWWMAPVERRNAMVEWATEVVIVLDGEHADGWRDRCDFTETEVTTVFEVSDVGAPVDADVVDPEVGTPEQPDVNTDNRTVRTHDVSDSDSVVGDRGVREGSVADLASDDGLTMEPSHTGESRDDSGDTGGTGVGSMSDRWA